MPIAAVAGCLDGGFEMSAAVLDDAVVGTIAIEWVDAPFAIEIGTLD